MDTTEVDPTLQELIERASATQDRIEALTAATERKTAERHDTAAMKRAMDALGNAGPIRLPGGVRGKTFADHLLDAGWDAKTQPIAVVDAIVVLESKAGSLDGGSSIEDAVPVRSESPGLGADTRFIQAHFPTVTLAADALGVTSYRQKSRSLASTTDMIRTLAATSTKPQTSTVAEVVQEPLKQIATISSGTPNVLLANEAFRNWVNVDIALAFRYAVDAHIVTEITAASVPLGDGGSGPYESILYAQEAVRAAGYNPTLIVCSPADALEIQLLQLTSGVTYLFDQARPSMIISPTVSDGQGFVCDPTALGTLYIKPFQLSAFEENAGASNTSTVRGESDGLFLTQRDTAAAYFALES